MYLVPNGTLPQSRSFASTNALGYYFPKKNCALKIKKIVQKIWKSVRFSLQLHIIIALF